MSAGWIEVAKVLGRDPTVRIMCPYCDGAPVIVSDHYVPGSQVFDRVLTCEACKASISMRKTYLPVHVAEVED